MYLINLYKKNFKINDNINIIFSFSIYNWKIKVYKSNNTSNANSEKTNTVSKTYISSVRWKNYHHNSKLL